VIDENNAALPFTVQEGALRFFAGKPGTVRVQMGDREMVYSLTLPDVPETLWKAPAGVRKGVPRAGAADSIPTDIWPWLALAGGLGLLIDWILFGRSRTFRLRPAKATASFTQWRKAS
jgi:hypothetical protein